jgi:hypothetical protein
MAPQSSRTAIQAHAIDKHWRENPGVFMPAIVTCMTVKGKWTPENPQRIGKKKTLRSQNKIAEFKTGSPTPDS